MSASFNLSLNLGPERLKLADAECLKLIVEILSELKLFYNIYPKWEIFMPIPHVLQMGVINVERYVEYVEITNMALFLMFGPVLGGVARSITSCQ